MQHIQSVEPASAVLTAEVGERASAPVEYKRIASIDALRGLAVLCMIETHVLNGCLDGVYKSGWLYRNIDLLNGFVSVAFLFCAGAGFWIAATKKRELFRRAERPLWLYVRRLLFILLIAYWLHLPTHSLAMLQTMPVEQWSRVFQFDILHTIVACLLVCLGVAFLPVRVATMRAVFAVLALGCFLAAPAVWQWHPEYALPLPLAMPFMEQPISKFPLFPWGGYLFAGAAVTGYFAEVREPKRVATVLAVAGFALLFFLVNTKWTHHMYYEMWWFVSPEHSLYRLLGVVAFFGVLYRAEHYLTHTRIGKTLCIIGQESLGFYMVHLLIVYGSVLNPGITAWLQGKLNPYTFALVTIAVAVATYGIVMAWRNLKQSDSTRAQFVLWAFAALFVLVFVIAPTY